MPIAVAMLSDAIAEFSLDLSGALPPILKGVHANMNSKRNCSRYRKGITITEVLVSITIFVLLLLLLLPAVQSSRESSRRIECASHQRQIGIAFYNYQNSLHVFPGAFSIWTYEILPFMEQQSLHAKIKDWKEGKVLDNHMHKTPVKIYVCPSDPVAVTELGWEVSYRMNDGYWPPKNKHNGFFRVFYGNTLSNDWEKFRSAKPSDITDGLSSTAALSEHLVSPSVGFLHQIGPCSVNHQVWNRLMRETWIVQGEDALDEFCKRCEYEAITPAQNYIISSNRFAALSNSHYSHELPPNRNSCYNGNLDFAYFRAITASSLHPGGVNSLMADGAVRFVSDSIDRNVWRAMSSRDGSEPITY